MTIPSNENWDAFYDDDDEIFIHKMKGNKIIGAICLQSCKTDW
jgi:hypothetical protein